MNFKSVSALLLPLLLSASVAAMNPGGGTWANVTVTGLTACTAARCPPHGWVTVQLSANATSNPPACSSDNRNSVAIDTSEGKGGAFAAAIAQSSMMLGSTISIIGTGNCSVDAVIETAGTVSETPLRNR